MNNQSVNKIKMFLLGLIERFKDNKDYFKGLEVVFKSGLKDYIMEVTPTEDENVKVAFLGKSISTTFEGALEEIVKNCNSYEAVTITYIERGTKIIITGDNKNVKIKYEDSAVEDINEDAHSLSSTVGNRDYLIKVGPANELLKEIGILTKDGKVKNDMVRKYNQIDHFVELIKDTIEVFEDKDEITILDCGCGKSYLSFVLNYYIKNILKKNCYFIGLDYSENVIKSSQKMAINLGYKNMEFIKTDIKNYIPDREIDMVISLHACDTATDLALSFGIRSNAKAIISVPCCQREVLSQYSFEPFDSILKHGILKARMADIITDGVRSLFLQSKGYKVSIIEYISPLETPKNLLIKAIRVKGNDKEANEEYRKLTELLNIKPSIEKYS